MINTYRGSRVALALSLLEHATHTRPDVRTVLLLRGAMLLSLLVLPRTPNKNKSQKADLCVLSFFRTGGAKETRIIKCEITQLALLLYIAFRRYKTISILACGGSVLCTA